ncbi:sugar ABC transporter substrate-binding protein [Tessaracoccus aquimaris]|uniref:Sugar ABC transporter substrate-binding protein n=1 Tax=Tessaracoccus aquimaris TaxID=1332264 RepID=A0A1Q2CMG6_9ACTN|nr:extracellular solute-binding protein [Tessaracoccus aquimaris]AQP47318.1 sugar ABC transporter substrate-binding protein [Tessaracoccus aquimaris]
MKRAIRSVKALSVAVVACLGVAACSPATSDPAQTGSPGAPQATEMTFWHNATTGDGKAFWDNLVSEFEASHPGVTIRAQAVQNEDFDGKLQTALNSPDAPDVFMQRGGLKMHDMVDAGLLRDVSGAVTDTQREELGQGAIEAMTYQDKVWAMPDTILPGGIWYSQDLFDKAGITEAPKTMDDLFAAIDKLKAAGITPIALGAKDAWPAAHWYYWLALRECSPETLDATIEARKFEDQCWTKAGESLEKLVAAKPFQDGLLTTPAQQGAGSSAGLLANHKAAMELMGAWNAGVIKDLTPNKEPLADLSWFPFPEIPGSKGAPGAVMGGMGGYSCSADAPEQLCFEFLQTIVKADSQIAYYKAFSVPPLNSKAKEAVTEPFNIAIMDGLANASFVSDWLDTRLGQNVGNALNTAVVDLLAGKGDAQHLIDSVNAAAAKE